MEQKRNKTREKIAIITDSCADVPQNLREEYSIFVLPMMISYSKGEYKDGVDIFSEDVYEILKSEMPKTSTPTGEDMEKLVKQLKEEGYTHAIAILLSGGLSGTVNHFRLMIEEESEISFYVVNSLQASIGIGAIVLQAAMWEKEGISYDILCKRVDMLCVDTAVFFSIDTLEYLQKGGRIGKATALVGTALSIKPILSFDGDGEIYTPAKVRGHKLVEKKLIQLVEDRMLGNKHRRYNLMVADGGAPEEREVLEAKLVALLPDYQNIFHAKIGAALSTYLGDGLLGAGIQFID